MYTLITGHRKKNLIWNSIFTFCHYLISIFLKILEKENFLLKIAQSSKPNFTAKNEFGIRSEKNEGKKEKAKFLLDFVS